MIEGDKSSRKFKSNPLIRDSQYIHKKMRRHRKTSYCRVIVEKTVLRC